VTIFARKEKRTLEILTNNFEVGSLDIADFYKSRWQVELFFKWIKQHLRIHNFYGRSQNAVRCQIWSAVCAYLMVAIVRKTLNLEKSLYELLQVISVNPFENQGLQELFDENFSEPNLHDLQKSFIFNDN
jgi:IS4 transposase